jgi:hypothetical protein
MCQRIRCERCGRPGYTGCGAHVSQVLADVPPDKRCQCPKPQRKSLLARLFKPR